MDFELVWWFAMLTCAIAFVLIGPSILNPTQNRCDQYVEDLDAWNRNYGKLQRRR